MREAEVPSCFEICNRSLALALPLADSLVLM